MDALEFQKVGAAIVELGGRLSELKAQRDVLDKDIVALETELKPLLVQHSKMIAELVGLPAIPPTTPPPPPVTHGSHAYIPPDRAVRPAPATDPIGPALLRKRIMELLRNEEPGVSALQIAERLGVDAYEVRKIMREFAESRSE